MLGAAQPGFPGISAAHGDRIPQHPLQRQRHQPLHPLGTLHQRPRDGAGLGQLIRAEGCSGAEDSEDAFDPQSLLAHPVAAMPHDHAQVRDVG